MTACGLEEGSTRALDGVMAAAIHLPAPFALARSTDTLTPGGRSLVWEAKWDGYRAQILTTNGRSWSRRGTDFCRQSACCG